MSVSRSQTFALLCISLLLGIGGCGSPADSGSNTQPSTGGTALVNNDASTGKATIDHTAIGSLEDYDAILNKYVKGDYFQYGKLRDNNDDLARFESFMRWQAQADVKAMSREEQIAFYINAYNSCCIKAILDHYPVHSPKDIDGFFDQLKFTVAGEELTVREVEYDRLIANYKDMRAHFAVVCADRGCLPLNSSAYRGSSLDADLEAAAKRFVGGERHFKVDKEDGEVQISKIFEWYGPKFLNDPDRLVNSDKPEAYLIHFVDKDVRTLLESGQYRLKVIEWDWTLNERIE